MNTTQKIPDFILLKKSREEVGQLTSEIVHLESEVIRYRSLVIKMVRELRKVTKLFKSKNEELNKVDASVKMELMREDTYKSIKKQNRKLRKVNSVLTKYKDKYFDLLARQNRDK